MSLDVRLVEIRECDVYDANITHNLNRMASAIGIYNALWRPDEHGYVIARDIIPVLEAGVAYMKANPEKCKVYDSPNGWGTYENFLPWCERYLAACKEHPDARIEVSR